MAEDIEDDDLVQALASDVPEIYFNSFSNYLSGSDVLTIMSRNGRPAAIVNMSIPIAKAYAEYVLKLVADHEKAAGYELRPDVAVE